MSRFLARFSRVTTSGRFLPEIDGLRFFAIGSVVLLHVNAIYWGATRNEYALDPVEGFVFRVLSLGGHGVLLFFVISGFILALPFATHQLRGGTAVDLGSYYWRRVTRLEPPYVLSMLVFFLVLPLTGKFTLGELVPHLIASLTYTHNVIYGEGSLINNNAWSLEIEIQFYLLVPLLVGVFTLGRRLRRALLSAVVLGFSLLSALILPERPWTILHFLQYFAAGFLLADFYLVDFEPRDSRSWRWDLIGAAAVAVLLAIGLMWRHSLLHAVATPWCFLVLCAAAFRGRALRGFCRNPWITTIGGMCYSIYLLHARLISLPIQVTMKNWVMTGRWTVDILLVAAILVPFVIIVSAIYFITVERPCMDSRWPQKLRARWVRLGPVGASLR